MTSPKPGDPLFPPMTVVVYSIGAVVEVEEDNLSSQTHYVDMIGFPWCQVASSADGGKGIAVYADTFDRNTTAVVLIYYSAAWHFPSHEGEIKAILLRAGEKASVNASLNTTVPIYRFDPSGTGTFEPLDPGTAAASDSVTAEYGVANNLGSLPQIFPHANSTYTVHERHQIVSRQTAQVVARGDCM